MFKDDASIRVTARSFSEDHAPLQLMSLTRRQVTQWIDIAFCNFNYRNAEKADPPVASLDNRGYAGSFLSRFI